MPRHETNRQPLRQPPCQPSHKSSRKPSHLTLPAAVRAAPLVAPVFALLAWLSLSSLLTIAAGAAQAAEPNRAEAGTCHTALAKAKTLDQTVLAQCSEDERVTKSVWGLLQQQRQLPIIKNRPEWEREWLEKHQLPELVQAVAALRARGMQEGATLSERQAGVALFMGKADSAVDVLQSQILAKRDVPQAQRWQAALLRSYDPKQAQQVYAQLLADAANTTNASAPDFTVWQQATGCSLQLGDGASALKLAQQWQKQAQSGNGTAHVWQLAASMGAIGDAQRLLGQGKEAKVSYLAAQKLWQALPASPLVAQELAMIGRKLVAPTGGIDAAGKKPRRASDGSGHSS